VIKKYTSDNLREFETIEQLSSIDFFHLSPEVQAYISEVCILNDDCFNIRENQLQDIINLSEEEDLFNKLSLELLKYGISDRENTEFISNNKLLNSFKAADFYLIEQLLLNKKEKINKSNDQDYISKILMEINSIVFAFTKTLNIISKDPQKHEDINLWVRKLKFFLTNLKKDINIKSDELELLWDEVFLSVDFLLVMFDSELNVNWLMSKLWTQKKHNKKQNKIWRLFKKIHSTYESLEEWENHDELDYLSEEFNKYVPFLRAKLDLQSNQFQQESYFEATCKTDKLQYDITELKNYHNSRFHSLIYCYYEAAWIAYDHKSVATDENRDILSKENIEWILEHFKDQLFRRNSDSRLYFSIIDSIMYYSDCIDKKTIDKFQKDVNRILSEDELLKYGHGDYSLFLSSSQSLFNYKARFLQEEKDGKMDGLTWLWNVKAYEIEIIDALKKSNRNDNYYGLLMLDIDNFKSINDTHGHIYWDIVLSTLASVLNENTREWLDKNCRIGGEEFTVIFETNNIDEALVFAEKLRKAIELRVIEKINENGSTNVIKKTPVTVSIGSDRINFTWSKEISKQELLIEAIRIKSNADKALYYSKENWKNKVTQYAEDLDK
jgi:diguanylate cyclase (GGDEF)-like protein